MSSSRMPTITPATPSSFLRPAVQSSVITPDPTPPSTSTSTSNTNQSGQRTMDVVEEEQKAGLKAIRNFLRLRTSYDVLPVSFRLIVLDTTLLVKQSLAILVQNGIVSAPLWDSTQSKFAGLLTSTDFINVIQYYFQFPDDLKEIDKFRLNSLREVERRIGVAPPETSYIDPMKPLYDACRQMLRSRARRIPLIDVDDETGQEMVVNVVTQYRILRFVAINVKGVQALRKPLRDLKIGCYDNLATATMDTPVLDVIHLLVKKDIASVPIINPDGGWIPRIVTEIVEVKVLLLIIFLGVVLNCYEAVDILTLIKGGIYDELSLTVGESLLKRPDDFAGIHTCTLQDRLDTIFDTIRNSRVHRFVVVDEKKRLVGILTLSDILRYILLEGNDAGEGS
ncbi:AMP-activated serine/threonine-protein kinase regulatory subunit [Orbilia oligospora]|uniref:AMP-activated serine/threonine-protein kinase regulatory subunit n=2 Tax=Orbilia oligospora TaxID=2813651 RepID=A0A7C8K7A0_ORBOL|nr:AMP-activated serine/threonine-protein kinase regulatory subunit, variant 2 [Orbilia oligospora]KAF3294861.1 AMP-activated serine/threonine-protein kinase regulatory subunit, variant 2 [Orbilia oligospora]TGJ65456.1 AMP-activated serine/threonine-protein kinase regulatory subunit [Orbilia oligospora]